MSASTGPAAPSLRDLREYPEGTVYVVHLDPPCRHARHYSGNPESSAQALGWAVTETSGWLGLRGRSYHDPRFAARQQACQTAQAARSARQG